MRFVEAAARAPAGIHEDVVHYAKKLMALPPDKRRVVKDIIDQLSATAPGNDVGN